MGDYLPIQEGSAAEQGTVLPGMHQEAEGPMSRLVDRVAHVARTAAVALELSPANGIIRYGGAAAVEVATGNGIVSTATLVLTTLMIEGAAGFAAPDLIASEEPSKLLNVAGKVVDKLVPPAIPLTVEREVVVANYLGTTALVLAKHRRDPSRTVEDNRSYGLRSAAWLSGGCAVQGALVFEGIVDDPSDIKVSLPAAALTLGAGWALRKLKGRSQSPEGGSL